MKRLALPYPVRCEIIACPNGNVDERRKRDLVGETGLWIREVPASCVRRTRSRRKSASLARFGSQAMQLPKHEESLLIGNRAPAAWIWCNVFESPSGRMIP